ncbi:MAG: LURP-one-related family protein [Clostridia bacterium]|nr:LURP-one-related family protein [Clostridia bacterium]
MKLYIKQHIFTWGDKFSIYNEAGEEVFFVEGEVFSFGKKLHLLNQQGQELAFIAQKVFSFLPRYYISRDGRDVAEVVKHFTLFRHEYSVEGLGWRVSGDFFAHEYSICDDEHEIARVSKEWFTWGDAYAIDIGTGEDIVNALAVVLVIDAVLQDQND